MHILGLLRLTLPSADPAASRQWWTDTLGVLVDDEQPDLLAVGDVQLAFGEAPGVSFVATGLPAAQAAYVDPAGTVIELAAPDEEAAGRAEATIRDFVREADALEGPAVDELTDQVAAVLAEARTRVAALITGVPHNKVLATQLNLSQRAREAMPSDEQWPLHAASSLMSGFIISGSSGG